MEKKILGVEKGKGRGIIIRGLFKPKCYWNEDMETKPEGVFFSKEMYFFLVDFSKEKVILGGYMVLWCSTKGTVSFIAYYLE